jgi:hypothetical protein
MTATPAKESRLIDKIEGAERMSLEAVRRFVDTVDGAFPDLGGDDGPRRKIIDSAFKMVEQLMGAANGLAQNILDVTEKNVSEPGQTSNNATE